MNVEADLFGKSNEKKYSSTFFPFSCIVQSYIQFKLIVLSFLNLKVFYISPNYVINIYCFHNCYGIKPLS